MRKHDGEPDGICEQLGIGQRIKAAREKRDISQENLATAVGVKRETLNHWEAETRQIKAGDLLRLCAALDVSADYLLGRIPNETHATTAICQHTGLSQKAADALDMSAIARRKENLKSAMELDGEFITPLGLDMLDRLLSSKDGLKALDEMDKYIHSGEYRFLDGQSCVPVKAPEIKNAAGDSLSATIITPDVIEMVHHMKFNRLLADMVIRPTGEALQVAKALRGEEYGKESETHA